MKSWMVIVVLSFIMGLYFCAPPAHPITHDGMVQYYRSAHETRNLNQVKRVVYWGNMPEKVKKRILDGIEQSFARPLKEVKLAPLPDDFEMKRGNLVYPFNPEKTLKVSYKNPDNEGGVLVGKDYFLGKKGDRVYIMFRLNPTE
jgi:hypothetical protein